jgi:hypothetical protein
MPLNHFAGCARAEASLFFLVSSRSGGLCAALVDLLPPHAAFGVRFWLEVSNFDFFSFP